MIFVGLCWLTANSSVDHIRLLAAWTRCFCPHHPMSISFGVGHEPDHTALRPGDLTFPFPEIPDPT